MKRKYELTKDFNNQDFFKLIGKCLASHYEFRNLKTEYDKLDQAQRYGADISKDKCYLTIAGQDSNVFFKLSQTEKNVDHTVKIILEKADDQRFLYLSYEAEGGILEYTGIPSSIINLLREINKNDKIIQSSLGKTGEIITANEDNKETIINLINDYTNDIPMVLASEYHDRDSRKLYEIDGNKLASALTCFAYVIFADYDFMDSIKDKTKRKAYNGTVTVFANRKHESFRKGAITHGPNLEKMAFDYVKGYTPNIEIPTLKEIKTIINTVKPQESKQVKELQEENQELKNQLEEMTQKAKNLEKALEQAKDKKFGIILPDEIYEGETLDLIHCAVLDYIEKADEVQGRIKQLGKEILDLNPATKNGEQYFNDLKIAIGNDGDLNNKQKSSLLSLGFKELRDNGHPIYEFKGHRFIMCSTSSDQRNGKKKFNQMKRTLCVYKYTDN